MKKVGLIVVAVLIAIAIPPLYYWHQLTDVPQTQAAANAIRLNDPVAIQQARQTVDQKLARIQTGPDGTATVELTGADVNALIASELVRTPQAQPIAAAVKQVNTTIDRGKLASGAVVNLSNLPTERLSPTEQAAVKQLVDRFPALAKRDVYIGVEGNPTVVDGRLQLGEPQLRIGNLRFSLAEVAQQLGLSETQFRQAIDRQLPLSQLGVQEVQISGNTVQIRGAAN